MCLSHIRSPPVCLCPEEHARDAGNELPGKRGSSHLLWTQICCCCVPRLPARSVQGPWSLQGSGRRTAWARHSSGTLQSPPCPHKPFLCPARHAKGKGSTEGSHSLTGNHGLCGRSAMLGSLQKTFQTLFTHSYIPVF